MEQLSRNSKAILEIRHPRDLEIAEKLDANGFLLEDDGPDGWGIEYTTEFHMTNDSKLFPPRPWWEECGCIPDEYGHWLKGARFLIEDCGYFEGRSKLDPKWKHWSILDRPRTGADLPDKVSGRTARRRANILSVSARRNRKSPPEFPVSGRGRAFP